MIDLHTHSTVSDGSEPPSRIPQLAKAAGCRAVALTDHDNLGGLPEAEAAAREAGVLLVRGCEVSCKAPPGGGSMHVLVYFVDGDEGPLHDELARLRADRLARNHALAERLRELGLAIDYDALVQSAGGEAGLGRPHFARMLVEMGEASDINDAFDKWLAGGRPAYVPKGRLEASHVAALATASGAVAVLAHPLTLGRTPAELGRLVRELADAGFSGLEAYYGRYQPDERAGLVALAREAGLVPTGGSDFHGDFKPDLAVGTGRGDLEVPDSVLEELAGRRPDRSAA